MKAKKWISLLICLVLVLGLLSGCGAKSSRTEMAYDMAVAETWAAQEAPMAANGSASLTDTGASTTTAPQNRKWIVTVDMDAETEDLDALLESITSQIDALGGYVEDQRVTNGSRYSTTRYRSASLTVRIPAEDVDSFTQTVSGVCNVVRSSKSLEDVTLTYVATESRMNALQTEEARLLELMGQAENMSDLLEIEARLTDVRYELESVTSQLRIYDNLVDYATIYLGIDEVTEYTPVEEETLWQRISGGGQNLAFERFAAVLIHRDGHGAGVRRAVARLHGVAVAEAHAIHTHVLVAGEHEVEIELPADAAGLVLAAFGERLAGFQVALKAAVIDQHGHVALRLDRLQRAGAGVHGILDDQLRNRPWVLPARDKGRARPDEADAQPVFELMDGIRRDGQQAVPISDVAAQALRVQLVQVIGVYLLRGIYLLYQYVLSAAREP